MLGIIGGSGLYSLTGLEVVEQKKVTTQYGNPSSEVQILRVDDLEFAFLPRHGADHSIPPHRIPYKANIAALKSVGVDCIVATCIAGSLQLQIKPGEFVVPDQFVNFTQGRDDTFDFDQRVQHTALADPYCPRLRSELISACASRQMPTHANGTVVVIQGPRFATRAESAWYTKQGWNIINMTQYPECFFARESGVCYACLAAVTDYDVGLCTTDYSLQAATRESVLPIFQSNIDTIRIFLKEFIAAPSTRMMLQKTCVCSDQALPYYQTT